MAQPSKIEMIPPKDMTIKGTIPERTASGVRSESTKTLRCKANVFDVTMQGRRSFTFEYEGTYQNPCFYDAEVIFSARMINTPRAATIGGTGYQMFQATDTDGAPVYSKYGPIIVPNNFADLFFERAVVEVLGETEIEPSTQTHQITKIVHLYMTSKPEEATFKYSYLGGYEESYDSTKATQLLQVLITIRNDSAIMATAGSNYKKITETQFTAGSTG